VPELTLQNARTLIESALVNTLLLALGIRNWTVADIPGLRAITTVSPSGSGELLRDICDLAFVTSAGVTYQWSTTATGADDGMTTIVPNDLPAGLPGRWLQTTSMVSQGYVLRTALYNEDPNDEEMVVRALAQQPAILVSYDGGSRRPRSKMPGSLYEYKARFTILVVSTDMRGGQTARQGSGIGTESTVNPGTGAMLGDVSAQLAGSTLGLNDVQWVEIGDDRPVAKSTANRRFVESLDVVVWATLTNLTGDVVSPDSEPYEFNVQRQLAGPFAGDSLINWGPPDKVEAPPLVSIALAPNPVSVPHGMNIQFTATGTYADGSTTDLTQGGLSWVSSTPTVATVNALGTAAGLVAGTTQITARAPNGVTSPVVTLTVT
jgi:hypothetical protein